MMDNGMTEFAYGHMRNDKGYIMFPKDMAEWKRCFHTNTKGHPAPMNLYLVQELVKYYTKEGDTILDPMAGCGTLMWAALVGRNVVIIELEEEYFVSILSNLNGLKKNGVPIGNITRLQGDCRKFLPLPVNHIIFSPPYSNIRGQKSKLERDIHVGTEHYRKSMENVGNLAPFLYKQAMMDVYRRCYDSLPSGGTMSIIVQDFIKQGKVYHLSKGVLQTCSEIGFKLLDWHRRFAPTTFFRGLTERQNPGQPPIDYEDVVVFQKGG